MARVPQIVAASDDSIDASETSREAWQDASQPEASHAPRRFHELGSDECSIDDLQATLSTEPIGSEFIFLDVTNYGDKAEPFLKGRLRPFCNTNQIDIGFCPEDGEGGVVSLFPNIQTFLERQGSTKNVFSFGAASFAARRGWEKRASESIDAILSSLKERRGGRVFVAFDKKTEKQICKIFDFIKNKVCPESGKNNLQIKRIELMGYGEIFAEVKDASIASLQPIFEQYADTVYENVFSVLEERLKDRNEDRELVAAFQSIREEQKEKLRPHLTKGLVHGGSRDNDRPWGLEKVAEETRQRLLAALVRQIAPPYRASSNIPVDVYIEENIQPYFQKFSLPGNKLAYAAPAAFGAKQKK